MNCVKHLIILALYLRVSVATGNKEEDRVAIRIKLNNTFHREMIEAIEETLKALPGVNSVNLTGMRSHAIIEAASAEVTAAQMISALGTLRGEDWQCMAELKSETAKLYHAEGKIDREKLNWVRHPQQGAARPFSALRPAGVS